MQHISMLSFLDYDLERFGLFSNPNGFPAISPAIHLNDIGSFCIFFHVSFT